MLHRENFLGEVGHSGWEEYENFLARDRSPVETGLIYKREFNWLLQSPDMASGPGESSYSVYQDSTPSLVVLDRFLSLYGISVLHCQVSSLLAYQTQQKEKTSFWFMLAKILEVILMGLVWTTCL